MGRLTAERAQQLAVHESPATTKLYDRTNDATPALRRTQCGASVSLDEIGRILI